MLVWQAKDFIAGWPQLLGGCIDIEVLAFATEGNEGHQPFRHCFIPPDEGARGLPAVSSGELEQHVVRPNGSPFEAHTAVLVGDRLDRRDGQT